MIISVESIRQQIEQAVLDQAEFAELGYSSSHLGAWEPEQYTEHIRELRIELEELFWDIPLTSRPSGASFMRGMQFATISPE